MKTSPLERRLAEITSILLWLFMLIKLFIYDIDNYFVKAYLPRLSWMLEYKFFILMVLMVLLLFTLKTKKFFKFIGYILGYPFFFFFWRLPRLLFGNKNWMGLFTALGTSVSFFKSLSLNLAISTSVLVAGLLLLVSNSKFILSISMVVLFAYLLIHFTRRFSYSFKKFELVTKLSKSILNSWTKIQDFLRQNETEKRPAGSENIEKQEGKDSANRLQWLLLFNKVCLFLISKLRYMKKSASTFIYYFVNLLGSVFITVFVFAFLNLGLYKIDHHSFGGQIAGRFIDFFYYSFGLFFGGINSNVSPAGSFAKILSVAEICFRFMIVVILLYYLFNIVREKHKTDIETSIVQLRQQGNELERVIKEEFQLSVDEAMKEVERLKGSMLVLINYLISNIDIKLD